MKKSILLSFFIISSAISAEEGVKLKSATVSWGDSAFTSGLDVSLLFSLKGSKSAQLIGNSERFYLTLNNPIGKNKKLSIDASGGVFKKLPWIGPRITYYPTQKLMISYWGGVSTGRIGNLKPEAKSFFQMGSLYFTPNRNFSVGYNVIKLDVYKTTHLPEAMYRYWFQESSAIGISTSYDTVARQPLFSVSLTHNFN